MSNQSKAAYGSREAVWRQIMESWRTSGVSVSCFCRQQGLAESTFYSWRKRLTEDSAGDDGSALPTRKATSPFVEVALPTSVSSEAAGRPEIPAAGSLGVTRKGSLPSAAKGVESPRLRSELSVFDGGSAGLELVLGGGVLLRIPVGVDRVTLGEVLAVLHEEGLC